MFQSYSRVSEGIHRKKWTLPKLPTNSGNFFRQYLPIRAIRSSFSGSRKNVFFRVLPESPPPMPERKSFFSFYGCKETEWRTGSINQVFLAGDILGCPPRPDWSLFPHRRRDSSHEVGPRWTDQARMVSIIALFICWSCCVFSLCFLLLLPKYSGVLLCFLLCIFSCS